MYRSLLVPLDGSPFGEQALPLALGIARRAGASVELVNVAAPLPLVSPEAPLVLDADLEAQVLSYRRGYLGPHRPGNARAARPGPSRPGQRGRQGGARRSGARADSPPSPRLK